MKQLFEEKRTEQRQHINLSNYAYSILRSDSMSFFGGLNISGIINTIFLNFYQSAEASVSSTIEHRKASLINYLQTEKYRRNHPQDVSLSFFSNDPISSEEERMIDEILSGYSYDIRSRLDNSPKQKVLKIRLRNEVQDIIYPQGSDDWLESAYYKTPSDYLKAVIEEYSHKCFFDREAIFLKNIIELMYSEIETSDPEKHILTITYNRPTDGPVKYDIKPYFMTDRAPSEYHNLVALSALSGEPKSEYKIAIFRMTWIENVQIRPKSYGSGRITKAQKDYLEDTMRDAGIPSMTYDSSERYDFMIRLTPTGLKKYYMIDHLRPIPELDKMQRDEDGNTILYFHTTFHQIHHYFWKLGKDAQILEPAFAQEAFRQEYEAAAAAYKLL